MCFDAIARALKAQNVRSAMKRDPEGYARVMCREWDIETPEEYIRGSQRVAKLGLDLMLANNEMPMLWLFNTGR